MDWKLSPTLAKVFVGSFLTLTALSVVAEDEEKVLNIYGSSSISL